MGLVEHHRGGRASALQLGAEPDNSHAPIIAHRIRRLSRHREHMDQAADGPRLGETFPRKRQQRTRPRVVVSSEKGARVGQVGAGSALPGEHDAGELLV